MCTCYENKIKRNENKRTKVPRSKKAGASDIARLKMAKKRNQATSPKHSCAHARNTASALLSQRPALASE